MAVGRSRVSVDLTLCIPGPMEKSAKEIGRTLLSALPQLGVKGQELSFITGTPPSLYSKIKGDAFAPRNPHALKIDFEEEPPYFKVSDTHYAKTWLLDPRAPKLEKPEVIQNLHEKIEKMTGKGGAFHVE